MHELLKEPHNNYLEAYLTGQQLEETEKIGFCKTVIRKSDGKVLCCGGVTEYWPGRGEGWCVFTKDCKKEFVAIFRAAASVFDFYPGRRVEAAIAVNFNEGHRWIKGLGFKLDAPLLKSYLPDGGDVSLYSRVR